ncbi:DUF6534 domain-containing protein [Sporobolomyces salmoneus]|uniref:DUF6534 domain-containing protein n=1 Tax=Sporobolomyces salmoneus TaxID=183962 RepID=UPI0031801358
MGLFDDSIGAFVVGTAFSTFLLGITSTQAYAYFTLFPNDKRLYWWLVVFMCILDWSHSAISMYTIYDWTVVNYGNPAHLVVSPWSFAVDPAMTGIAACICQFFYAYRVYIVGKRGLLVPVLVCVLALVSLGFAVGSTAQIFILQEFAKFQSFTYGVAIWLAVAALADVIITVSLVYYLQKSKTGLLQTNSMLNRLIELIISTNSLTAVIAVVDAILFGVSSSSWHVSVNLCLIKLYFNSLLVSLNARADLERYLSGSARYQNDRSRPLPAYAHSAGANTGTHSVGYSSTHTTAHVERPDMEKKTMLGFGAEDCNPAIFYQAKAMPTTVADGIKVTTHSSVVTDHAAYPPRRASDKDLSFDEKDTLEGDSQSLPPNSIDLLAALERSPDNSSHSRHHDNVV